MSNSAERQPNGLPKAIAVYTLLRLGLVAVITVLLTLVIQIPFIVALLLAIILQLPLSMMFFRSQQRRVVGLVDARFAVRREERERLRNALRGDQSS